MNAFSALSDPTRREIIVLIASANRLTATEIAANFDISAPAVSQHLKVLREANLVQVKKQAQKRVYSINQQGMNEISSWILDVKKLGNRRFSDLDKYLQNLSKSGKRK